MSDGNVLGVEQIACLKEMLQPSPLQYHDAVSSCHPDYTWTKDDSSTAAKTATALCTFVKLCLICKIGSVISMDEWTEHSGGCGFMSQVEDAKLRDLNVWTW